MSAAAGKHVITHRPTKWQAGKQVNRHPRWPEGVQASKQTGLSWGKQSGV